MKLPEYASMTEKKEHFNYVKIDTKDVLDTHLGFLLSDRSNCIFRGVGEAKYKLFTSVQRHWIGCGLGRVTTIDLLVDTLIRNIRKNEILDQYYSALNIIPTDLLYLGVLQHYAAPSPLLDFTYDYRIALYFATCNTAIPYTDNEINDYCSLYYIDLATCGAKLVRLDDYLQAKLEWEKREIESCLEYGVKPPNLDTIIKWLRPDDCMDRGLCDVKMMFVDAPHNFKRLTTPWTRESLYWANLNIVAQQGCFLLYNNDDVPLEEYFGAEDKIWCLDIHKSLIEYIRARYLQDLSESKLFPDMRQLAQDAYRSFLREL